MCAASSGLGSLEKYGKLYTLKFPVEVVDKDAVFVFRLLNLREYKIYERLAQRSSAWPIVEQEVYKTTVIQKSIPDIEDYGEEYLYNVLPEDLSDEDILNLDPELILPAGIITSLVRGILYLSCPKSIDGWSIGLEMARARSNRDIEIILKSFICSVIPYKPEELDELTFEEFMMRVAIAEQIMLSNPKLPLTIQSPEDAQKEAEIQKTQSKSINFERDATMLKNVAGSTAADEELQARMRDRELDPREAFLLKTRRRVEEAKYEVDKDRERRG